MAHSREAAGRGWGGHIYSTTGLSGAAAPHTGWGLFGAPLELRCLPRPPRLPSPRGACTGQARPVQECWGNQHAVVPPP